MLASVTLLSSGVPECHAKGHPDRCNCPKCPCPRDLEDFSRLLCGTQKVCAALIWNIIKSSKIWYKLFLKENLTDQINLWLLIKQIALKERRNMNLWKGACSCGFTDLQNRDPWGPHTIPPKVRGEKSLLVLTE